MDINWSRPCKCGVAMATGRPEQPELQIEEGIQIPPPMRIRSRIRDLNINQSILITNYTRERSVRELAYQIGIELRRKFSVRQMSEGVRVFRIE